MLLTPETVAFIDGRVASGRHRDAGEAVRATPRPPGGRERSAAEILLGIRRVKVPLAR